MTATVFLWEPCSFGNYCQAPITGIFCNSLLQVLVDDTINLYHCQLCDLGKCRLQMCQFWVDVHRRFNEQGESGTDHHYHTLVFATALLYSLHCCKNPVSILERSHQHQMSSCISFVAINVLLTDASVPEWLGLNKLQQQLTVTGRNMQMWPFGCSASDEIYLILFEIWIFFRP